MFKAKFITNHLQVIHYFKIWFPIHYPIKCSNKRLRVILTSSFRFLLVKLVGKHWEQIRSFFWQGAGGGLHF